MYEAQIVAARESAGRLLKMARDLGTQIAGKQEKNEPTGELDTQFDKAHVDATTAQKELNRWLGMQETERAAKEFETPAPVVRETRIDADVEPLTRIKNARERRRQQRDLMHRREMFSRAGVTTLKDFERFREAHIEAFLDYVVDGYGAAARQFELAQFKPQEAMALLTTSGDLGGFLAPDEFRAEVLKDMAGFAIMRRLCRVERTGASALVFPSITSATTDADVYSSGYTGAWKAEGYVTGGTAPTVQNQPRFGQARVPVHAWAPDAVEVTPELLQDSQADLDGILAEVIAETKGLDEDAAFLNGSGVNRPLGVLNTLSGTSVTRVNTGHATLLTYDGLIDLFSQLPAQYRMNAKFVMSSRTYGAILKLKDGNGMPLFPVNMLPNTLWGKQIEFSEFMPEIAAATDVILFGDFRHYVIADRQELRLQRLVERYAPNIGILPTSRAGGQPVRPAAFRKQYVSA